MWRNRNNGLYTNRIQAQQKQRYMVWNRKDVGRKQQRLQVDNIQCQNTKGTKSN